MGTLRAHDAIADALEASAAGARNGAPARRPWRWGAAASTTVGVFLLILFLGGERVGRVAGIPSDAQLPVGTHGCLV